MDVYFHFAGTGEIGTDFLEVPTVVTIPAGSAMATVRIEPIDDRLFEGPETVVLVLEPPACLPVEPALLDCYAIGRQSEATIVIHDDDTLPPRLSIEQPEPGSVFAAPAEIEVTAKASDPDGWVSLVEFFANGTRIGELALAFIQPPPPGQVQIFTFEWKDVPAGSYRLKAVATDDRGSQSESGSTDIRVFGKPRDPLVTVFALDPMDGQFRFHVAVPPGISGRIEGSEDLATWEIAGGTVANEDGIAFVEPWTSDHPHRFYRFVRDEDLLDLEGTEGD